MQKKAAVFWQSRNFLLLFLFLLSSCVAPSQTEIPIQPQINIPTAQIGHNKKIALVVEDARVGDQVVGRTAMGTNIKLSNDMLDNIKVEISKGLQESGFQPLTGNETSSTKLVVRILGIQYNHLDSAHVVWKVHTVATAVIEVVATSKNNTYKKVYRTDNLYANAWPSTKSDIDHINITIGDSLTKLLTDKQLIEFLAR